MTEEEKIFAGLMYSPVDPELKAKKLRAHKLNLDYNNLYEDQQKERQEILQKLLGKLGKGTFIQGPITFHYGEHTQIGENCFINFNFTVQDDAKVTIGNNCNFGPNVTIVTPNHPLLASERCFRDESGQTIFMCQAKPVVIGNNCWFGANVVVCPGVTVGDNSVIGAGSVVTKNIPSNVLAVGNPCRVVRELTESNSIENKIS